MCALHAHHFTARSTYALHVQASDLLVQLVHDLLGLMELHATLLGRDHGGSGDAGGGGGRSSPSPLLSPYLGGALLWCLTRVATAYLLPDVTLYEVWEELFSLFSSFFVMKK